MQLKDYQQNALDQLAHYCDALKQARVKGDVAARALAEQGYDVPAEITDHPRAAWDALRKQNVLPAIGAGDGAEVPAHITRTAASGAPIPHVCLKVPTGGGKTLLGVRALERIKSDTGLVLWIVPSRAIYAQTLQAFQNREHPYRQMLEQLSGGKVKVLEKSTRFTRLDVENFLCVMMLMLPAANRWHNKDFLKMFRDSSGYASFFPEEDDARANEKLRAACPDLETGARTEYVLQSLFNVLKQLRPTVILDEAHKAYGTNDARSNREFVEAVNRLNPRFVLELSATPKTGISNILVNIAGTELQREEMIKLPIEIHNLANSDWKHTLAAAKAQLEKLERDARELQHAENRYIRPIALVRVERTGEKQRGTGKIHAEHAREYLIRNLKVPAAHIRVQASERKELDGEDLLGEQCAVRWIITKDALKEGWDCAFAYVLALLDNTSAETAITQMTGRVMRQPHARLVKKHAALNRCMIFCFNQTVRDAVRHVKSGLESEGLSGLGGAVTAGGGENAARTVTIKPRKKYRTPKVFLPRVLHRARRGWRLLDYERDILSAVCWEKLGCGKAVDLHAEEARTHVKVTVDLQDQVDEPEKFFARAGTVRVGYFARRLADVLPNPWQAARIAQAFLQKQRRQNSDAQIFAARAHLAGILRDRISRDAEKESAKAFSAKIACGDIKFDLQTDRSLQHELNKPYAISAAADAQTLPIQQSMFEPVYAHDFNNLERNFAVYLDGDDAVKWWHRIAQQQDYALQGWQRHRVFPDFVACRRDGKLLVLETKGMHLSGNPDTVYKQTLLQKLEQTCRCADDVGEYKTANPPAAFRMLFENNWREEMAKLLAEQS